MCESAAAHTKSLVAEWLEKYMLRDEEGAAVTAQNVAAWLADDRKHLSRSRAITIDELQARGLQVSPLEGFQELQDAVLSVHHRRCTPPAAQQPPRLSIAALGFHV
jgi:hypothetical protein